MLVTSALMNLARMMQAQANDFNPWVDRDGVHRLQPSIVTAAHICPALLVNMDWQPALASQKWCLC